MKRNKILYFPGLLITSLGSVLFSFSTGLYLLDKTGRSDIFAGNILVSSLPLVFASIFFGKIVDSFSKKSLLVFSDFLNAFLMFFVFFFWNKIDQISLIYIASFITSLLSLLVSLTFEAAKPQLFNKEELLSMNSFSSITESLTRVLGPVLGGVILSLYDLKSFILFNGFSFIFSGISEILMIFNNEKNEKIEGDKEESNFVSLVSGFKHIWNNKSLKYFTILIALANIGFAFLCLVPIPYLILNYYKFSKEIYGVIMGISSIGMITGGILVSKFKLNITIESFKKLFFILFVISLFLSIPYVFQNIGRVYLISICTLSMFSLGVIVSLLDIPMLTFIQLNTSENIRGQVIGSFISVVKLTLPLSLILSAKIVDKTNPFVSIVIGGILYLVVSIRCSKLLEG